MVGLAPLEADDLAVDGDVAVEVGDVEPFGIGHRAVGVGDGDDLGPLLVQEPGGEAADVAVTLDGEGRAGDRPAEPREHLAGDDRDAVAGGRLAAGRAVQLDGLAGDAGRGEAVELAVLVHDPGHDLGVGADVGGGDVLVRADEVVDLLGEPAGQPLQLARESLVGSQLIPPLPPPNGRSTTAVFQVIRLASERASSWSTWGDSAAPP